MPLILSNDDVAQALDLRAGLEAFETAYRELTCGRAVNRPTTQTYLPHALPDTTYSFKSVEGGISAFGVMALRLTSDHVTERVVNDTPRVEKLPLANGRFVALVQVFSVETGELLAIMPDGLIQQTRVGLTSALGARCLARADVSRLALLGSGGQARAHIRTLTATLPITSVAVYSQTPGHCETFAREMEQVCGVEIRPVATAQDAIRDADMICSATSASRPIVRGAWLEPGVHYNAIREFEHDEDVFTRSDVVAIHSRFGGAHHYQPPGHRSDLPGVRREKERDWSRYPEIGELLAGTAPGRTSDRQITFFLNNIGTGVQFAALGWSVLVRARERGLGRELPAEWFVQDIKP